MSRSTVSLTVLAALLFTMQSAPAQQPTWRNGGVSVATSGDVEQLNNTFTDYALKNMNVAGDGTGGAICSWARYSDGRYFINAQRIDGSGNPVWTNDAAGVCVGGSTGSNGYRTSQVVSDGAGGAYIGWNGVSASTDGESHFIQHVSAAGELLWGDAGYVLTPAGTRALTADNAASIMQMESDGSGGVIVAFYACGADPTNGAVYVARLSGNGATPQFAFGPVAAIPSTSSASYMTAVSPVIASDGAGGLYAAGAISDASGAPASLPASVTNGTYHVQLARVNADGSVEFNMQLTSTPNPPDASYGFQLIGDGNGGALFAYTLSYDGTSGSSDQTFGMRIANNGSTLWGPITLHHPQDSYQVNARIAADGNGGMFVTLADWNYSSGMYLQHVDVSGNLMFNAGNQPAGILLGELGESYAQVIDDGRGNAICTWAVNGSVVAQKFEAATGNAAWGYLPVTVSTSGSVPTLAADGVGGAVIAWNINGADIRAQRVIDETMAPHAKLSVIPFDVGNVRVGSTKATSALNVINARGIYDLVLTSVASTTGRAALVGPSLPMRIAPSFSTALQITCTAAANGFFTDTLLVNGNDPLASPLLIPICGVGVYPHLSVADGLGLGNGHVGTATLDSIAIVNSGTDTLHVTSMNVTGENSADFTIASTLPMAIPAGCERFVTVAFTPATTGWRTASLAIVSDDSGYVVDNTPRVLSLGGLGVLPHMEAATSMVFPATSFNTGQVSIQALYVTNTGTENLIISRVEVLNGDPTAFSVDGDVFPVVIAPGAAGRVQIAFAPHDTAGVWTATLGVYSNDDPASPFHVSVSGLAVLIAPSIQSVAYIAVERTHVGLADTVTYTLGNAASATDMLIIRRLDLRGDFASSYRLLNAPTLPCTLQAGESLTLTLQFRPLTGGVLPAALAINSNAASAYMEVPILGEGSTEILYAQAIDFGRVKFEDCRTLPLVITNFGTEDMTLASVAVEGIRAGEFVIGVAPSESIPPLASVSVPVRFCAGTLGSRTVHAVVISTTGDIYEATVRGWGGTGGNLAAAANVDFGVAAVRQSVTVTVPVVNVGEDPTTVSSVTLNRTVDAPFTVDITVPVTVAAGDTLLLPITFQAATAGPKFDTVGLHTLDATTLSIAVTGVSTMNPFTLSATRLFVDTIPAGTIEAQMLLLTNFTQQPQRIVSVAFAGADAGAYTLYPVMRDWPVVIPPQTTDTFTVVFSPLDMTRIRTYPATLVFDETTGSRLAVTLTGTATIPTAVEPGTMPVQLSLTQNHPNPFSAATEVEFTLCMRSAVTLTITDVLGREVQRIVDAVYDAGRYHAIIHGEPLPAGSYQCTLRTAGLTLCRQMQVVH